MPAAICRCGREIGPVPHCPKCGSTNVYGRKASDGVMQSEGGPVMTRGFCCRHCRTDFHEGLLCEAPFSGKAALDSLRRASANKAQAEQIKASLPNRREIDEAILRAAKLARQKKADDEKEENLEDIFKKAEDDARENGGKAN